jgi:RNA polymerase sigma-B factor
MSLPPVESGPPRALSRRQVRERTAHALATRAESSSEKRRQELLEYVVSINMDVAKAVALRYANRGIETDDLLQVAYTALTRAARDFDPGRHDEFLSYAVPTMRGELKKHFRDRGWMVRPPRRIQEAQGRIARAESTLGQELGRSPKPTEIADHLGLPLDEVIEAMAADGCFTPASLDRPVDSLDGAATLGDLLGDPDLSQPAAEARAILAPVVPQLTERDRRILYLRFFEERTQEQIGEEIGVTQMQVSRLLRRILRDLRTELDKAEPAILASVPTARRDGEALLHLDREGSH